MMDKLLGGASSVCLYLHGLVVFSSEPTAHSKHIKEVIKHFSQHELKLKSASMVCHAAGTLTWSYNPEGSSDGGSEESTSSPNYSNTKQTYRAVEILGVAFHMELPYPLRNATGRNIQKPEDFIVHSNERHF